jgi:TonB family protein
MRCSRWVSLCFLAVAVSRCAPAQERLVLSAPVLEQNALVRMLPPYPPESQRQMHEGVAVCVITVSPDGSVSKTQMLQAPDAAISDAITSTLKKWRFRAMRSEGKPVSVSARMIFYFKRAGHEYTVIDAAAEEVKRQAGKL